MARFRGASQVLSIEVDEAARPAVVVAYHGRSAFLFLILDVASAKPSF